MRCERMNATISSTLCIKFQEMYDYKGHSCKNCVQGKLVKQGKADDADIETIKKLYIGQNFFVQN